MLKFIEQKVGQTLAGRECDETLWNHYFCVCLLDCPCFKPYPSTETGDMTSMPSSHSNWPGGVRELAALLFIPQTFLHFSCSHLSERAG